MNTRFLLSASAILLGAAGLAASFAPDEMLTAAGVPCGGALPVIVQLLGALWFASAMMNWTARGSLIGGIYNRPVAIANLTHFVIGALALVKAAMRISLSPALVVATVVYAVLAIAFALVFFRSPVQELPATA